MKENKFQTKGFIIWGVCCLFFLYEFLLRTVVGTFQHPIMLDMHLNTFQFSLLSTTIFLLVFSLMQIPVGIIVDNIGIKKSLLIGAVCCSISSIGFAYAYSYHLLIMYRMIMGFGAAFGFICLLISINEWMPHKYGAIFIGLSQFIGTLGPMIAAGPLETISESSNIDWRFIFVCLGIFGVFMSFLVLFIVENNNEKTGKHLILHKPQKITTSVSVLFNRTQPWFIAIVSACLYFTVEYFSENEGRSFLILKNINPSNAGYMITYSWIGYAIGCPLLGFLSDMLERRKLFINICAFLNLTAVLLILYSTEKMYLQIGFILVGFSAGGQSIGFAIIGEQVKKQFIAIAFALNNAMMTILSAIMAPTIGLLLDFSKTGEHIEINDYLFVFKILIMISMVAIILSTYYIKETYCKSVANFTILDKSKK